MSSSEPAPSRSSLRPRPLEPAPSSSRPPSSPGHAGSGPIRLALAALAAILLLVSCAGTGSGPSAAEGQPTPTDAGRRGAADEAENRDAVKADEPAETTPGVTIRDTDFATVEWREAVAELYVVPVDGDGDRTYTIGETVAFADVDGDGHQDALVPLQITDGQGFEQVWYIWTWDPAAEAPVQVESPVAREARCGDSVREVSAQDGVFVISEALRVQDDPAPDCATEGYVEVVRHVTLEDGWPVLTGPLAGDGGICPQRGATDDLFPVEDYVLRSAPFDDAGAVTEPTPLAFDEVDVWDHRWLFRDHWVLVHFTHDGPRDGGYLPCAWAYVEVDERPVPHAPHLAP